MKHKDHITCIQVGQYLDNEQIVEYNFSTPFTIGRDSDCDLYQDNDIVSRLHAEVFHDEIDWWIRDLTSANGTFVNNQRINECRITERCTVNLGLNGVELLMQPLWENSTLYENTSIIKQIIHRFFKPNLTPNHLSKDHSARSQDLDIQFKQKSVKYSSFIIALLMLAIVRFGIYQYTKLTRLRDTAAVLFDAIKTMEVQLAQQEINIIENGTLEDRQNVDKQRKRLSKLQAKYAIFLKPFQVQSIFPNRETIGFQFL